MADQLLEVYVCPSETNPKLVKTWQVTTALELVVNVRWRGRVPAWKHADLRREA